MIFSDLDIGDEYAPATSGVGQVSRTYRYFKLTSTSALRIDVASEFGIATIIAASGSEDVVTINRTP